MTKYQAIITADTNDADYITEITELQTDSDKSRFINIVSILKQYSKKSYGSGIIWDNSDYNSEDPPEKMYEALLTEEDFNFFNHFIPYGEVGIHTIKCIKIQEVSNEEKLL